MSREAGVTIVELAVVIAIVAITAAAVWPIVGSALGDSKARAAAEQIVVALRLARQNALMSAAIYQVTMSSSSVSVTCTTGVPAGNLCPANRPPDTYDAVMNGAVLAASTSPFNFGPTGAATVGIITISYPSAETWEVAVNASGRIRSCTPACL